MSDVDFWLLPAGLDQQAGVIDAWCAELASMNKSLAAIVLRPAADAELYNYAVGQASAIHTGMLQWIAHMQNVLTGISTELRSVAAEGRTIDLAAAARLDTYDPTEYNGFDAPEERPRRFGDDLLAPEYDRYDEAAAPVYLPKAPGPDFYLDAGPGAFEGTDGWDKRLFPEDLMSPTGWVRTILEHVGATSYRQQILSAFGGNWGTLRWYAFELNGISKFLDDFHSALIPTFGAISVYWQGYSANSAQAYFALVLKGVEDAAAGAANAASSFTAFADSIKSAAEILGDQVESFSNTVLFAAAAAAFGASTSETIIGGIFGAGAAGAAILRATQLWMEIRSAIEDAQTLRSILQTVSGLASDMSDFTSRLAVPQIQETG